MHCRPLAKIVIPPAPSAAAHLVSAPPPVRDGCFLNDDRPQISLHQPNTSLFCPPPYQSAAHQPARRSVCSAQHGSYPHPRYFLRLCALYEFSISKEKAKYLQHPTAQVSIRQRTTSTSQHTPKQVNPRPCPPAPRAAPPTASRLCPGGALTARQTPLQISINFHRPAAYGSAVPHPHNLPPIPLSGAHVLYR